MCVYYYEGLFSATAYFGSLKRSPKGPEIKRRRLCRRVPPGSGQVIPKRFGEEGRDIDGAEVALVGVIWSGGQKNIKILLWVLECARLAVSL